MRIETHDPEYGPMAFDAVTSGPSDGDLVLLLHGFPQTKYAWRHQLAALAAAGYRAVAVDQRGYSPGARPPDVAAYRVLHLAADVLRFADALGADRFHLVGHDWGAQVGWQVAGRHGERLASYTALSVGHPLAMTAARRDTNDDQRDRSSYFDWFRRPQTDAELGEPDGLRALCVAAGLSEEEAEPYVRALGSPEAIRGGLNWYRAMSRDDASGLAPVTTPVLYVWSTDDIALGRRQAFDTQHHVAGPYRFEVVEGVDHWIAEHAPDLVNRLLIEHLAAYPLASSIGS